MGEDIDRIFTQDIIDKKKALSGLRGRATRTGNKGPMKTPVDFLTGAEKKAYKKSGKVVKTSMYDTLMTNKEFEELTSEQKKKTIEEYRKKFSNLEIARALGFKPSTYYSRIKALGVELSTYKEKTKIEKEGKEMKEKPTKSSGGLSISLEGTFSSKELEERLSSLGLILKEGAEFTVSISIKEKG